MPPSAILDKKVIMPVASVAARRVLLSHSQDAFFVGQVKMSAESFDYSFAQACRVVMNYLSLT
jgi:hypothetical protein